MLFLLLVRRNHIRVISLINLDDVLLNMTLGNTKPSLFVYFLLFKKQNIDIQYMCLLVNNSYKAFTIYGVKHVEHAMHKTFDDTPMLNPPTRASHTFPTMRYNVTLVIWTSALKEEENRMTRAQSDTGQDDPETGQQPVRLKWNMAQACHSIEACDLLRVISQHGACGYFDLNEILFFFFSVSLAVSFHSTCLCVHVE